ncbi:preprotein translocase subunit SecE [Rhodococcus sp. NPDC058521]|uniref:preprotein translocase subunit SecE n=1 Tax=Rhodococcus sp. NPDC058521 TaxID=3346536 RepID=UPI00365AFB68
MSEERGKRDGDTSGSTRPEGVDDTDAVAGTRSSAPTGKPSGKRSARRRQDDVVATSVKAPAKPARTSAKDSKDQAKKPNIFKRLRRFIREVIAELRKVIWPNRKQMITYTSVVIVFLIFMVAFIFGVDLAVGQGVTWLFG